MAEVNLRFINISSPIMPRLDVGEGSTALEEDTKPDDEQENMSVSSIMPRVDGEGSAPLEEEDINPDDKQENMSVPIDDEKVEGEYYEFIDRAIQNFKISVVFSQFYYKGKEGNLRFTSSSMAEVTMICVDNSGFYSRESTGRGRVLQTSSLGTKEQCATFRIAAYSDLTRPDLTFVSTSCRHPWDPTLGTTLVRMSAMANTTPIVTTVTKTATNEKAPKETDAAPRVNIQDFYEEHYKDNLPVIMDKVRRDKRKEVHTRLDFGDNTKRNRRTRESSQNSSAGTWSAKVHQNSVKKAKGRESPSGAEVPSTMIKDRSPWVGPFSYHEKRKDKAEKVPAYPCIAERHSDGGRWNSRVKRTAEETYDEVDLAWCPWDIVKDGYKYLKAAFLAYFIQQKKYVKDPVEIHNIKQRNRETLEDFMEHFKVETGRMKGAPECMRISGFMHGVNNPELTKRINEHVPKIMKEMMAVTTAFIRGETAAASKKKGHAPWKPQVQSKRHVLERKSNFQGQSREVQGSNRFTSLTRTPKEILAAKAGKFKPPPPTVTPVEKRSSIKFCDFHNDKGHSTDECMQLKKQIEELVRAEKLSHLIKEIKQGRDSNEEWEEGSPSQR
ncbi:hypothetical protein Tco_0753300 [Tanacetum coccineum]